MEVFDIATGMWSFVELCPFANVLSGTCRQDWLLSVPGPSVWTTILAGTAVIPGAGSRCVNQEQSRGAQVLTQQRCFVPPLPCRVAALGTLFPTVPAAWSLWEHWG